AAIENILQAASGNHEGWECGIPQDETGIFFSIRLNEMQQELVPPSDLPLFTRHTSRLPFSTKPLPGSFHGFLEDQKGLKTFEGKESLGRISELVRKASMARFRTKEIHEWFAGSLRFRKEEVERGDGLDVSTFGLPPGGRALVRFISDWNRMSALNRLGGYRLLASMEAASITKAGAVIAITGKPGMGEAVEAGRLMERVWIEANANGFGVQPYFIVSDQIARLGEGSVPDELVEEVSSLEADARQVLGLDGDVLHMLLRVGISKGEPVRSVRLPLDAIFSVTRDS
ncbi:MAG TPA: hypothetical protein PLK99_12675, partial [Burkholderiales bacterium]|nr:hypothetical protein [Burkholderiales bacterium]